MFEFLLNCYHSTFVAFNQTGYLLAVLEISEESREKLSSISRWEPFDG